MVAPSERAAGQRGGCSSHLWGLTVGVPPPPERQRAWRVSPPGGRFCEEPLVLSQTDGHGLAVSGLEGDPGGRASPPTVRGSLLSSCAHSLCP